MVSKCVANIVACTLPEELTIKLCHPLVDGGPPHGSTTSVNSTISRPRSREGEEEGRRKSGEGRSGEGEGKTREEKERGSGEGEGKTREEKERERSMEKYNNNVSDILVD